MSGDALVAKYVTTAEAARLLGVSVRSVRRLAARGVFAGARPRFYPGTSWLIPRSALEQFLAGVPELSDVSDVAEK